MLELRKWVAAILLVIGSPLAAQGARETPLGKEWHSGLTGYRGFSLSIFVSGVGVDTFRLR